jgi:hypothetical protein
MFEPKNYLKNTTQLDSYYSQNTTLLEDRNINITSKIASIFEIFEDFTFVAHLREEIEKVKQASISTSFQQA